MTNAVVYTKGNNNEKVYLYVVTYSAENAQAIADEMNKKGDGNHYFTEHSKGYKDL